MTEEKVDGGGAAARRADSVQLVRQWAILRAVWWKGLRVAEVMLCWFILG